MKKSSWFKRALIIIFLLIIISITIVISYLDSIAQKSVEVVGTSALGVPVSLENVKISVLGGSLALNNLEVGNPEGFKTESLFKLGHCSTKVDIGSLMDETIVVNDVTINDLEITFEQKGMTSNLQALLDSLSGTQQQTEQPDVVVVDETEGGPDATAGKNLRLDRFYISGAKVRLKLLPLPGKQSDLTLKMAPITLENVSSDSDKGELAGVVIQKVFIAISQAVIETIAKDIPAAMLEGLKGSVDMAAKTLGAGAEVLLKSVSGLGQLGIDAAGATIDQAGEIIKGTGQGLEQIGEGTLQQLENAGKGIEDGVKGLGKGVEDIGKGLKGLFEKKEDTETKE